MSWGGGVSVGVECADSMAASSNWPRRCAAVLIEDVKTTRSPLPEVVTTTGGVATKNDDWMSAERLLSGQLKLN